MFFKSYLFKIFFLLATFSLLSCSGKEAMTEYDVKSFFESVEKAINAKDAETVLAGVSDNVEITLKMLSPDGNQEISMTKDEYAKNMKETFSVAQDYTYRVDSMDIDISADGKTAIVKLKTYEEMTMQGQNMRAVSKGENELKMINGKLQAVKIDAVVILQQ